MVIDFRKYSAVTVPVVISGQAIEVVSQYKFLGTILDSRLTFEAHADPLCQRMHLMSLFFCLTTSAASDF